MSSIIIALIVSTTTCSSLTYTPRKLHVEMLSATQRGPADTLAFSDPLMDVGLLAVEVPGLGHIRRRALLDSHKCAAETKAGIELADGTVRKSIAGSISRDGLQPLDTSCAALDVSAEPLRDAVFQTALAFGGRLDGLVGEHRRPLLAGREATYETVGDVVARGDHLEHFHSYRREGDTGSGEAAAPAVDHHVDQGLFIAFTPSLTVGEDAPGGVFSVELRDGRVADVDLDGCDDCVYFMLGDGVDQYVNDEALGLRAAPHALTMFDGLDRSWYGLMVLPPRDALSPLHGGAATFGEVRDRLRLGGAGDLAGVVGCSGGAETTVRRELASTAQCAGDELYCWYRCMPLVNHDGEAVSEAICADQGYARVNCTDIFRQPSDGAQHGDYYPQCTSYTHEATAFPSIAPADEGDCGAGFADAVAAAAEAFDGTVDLVYGGRAWEQSYFVPKTVGSLSWTVAGDAVTFKQVVDGRVGWMAVGLENPGGKHNGMNGASIVMAIPDAATAGLEEVDTYVIGESSSSFRNWYDSSSGAALRDAALDVAEGACYTAATYTLGSVFHANETVDPTKCVDLIWATSKDSNVASDPLFKARGMHEYRGKISVNLTHPAGACYEPPAPGPTAAPAAAPTAGASSKSSGGGGLPLVAVVAAALGAALLLAAVAGACAWARARTATDAAEPVKVDKLELAKIADEESKADAEI